MGAVAAPWRRGFEGACGVSVKSAGHIAIGHPACRTLGPHALYCSSGLFMSVLTTVGCRF